MLGTLLKAAGRFARRHPALSKGVAKHVGMVTGGAIGGRMFFGGESDEAQAGGMMAGVALAYGGKALGKHLVRNINKARFGPGMMGPPAPLAKTLAGFTGRHTASVITTATTLAGALVGHPMAGLEVGAQIGNIVSGAVRGSMKGTLTRAGLIAAPVGLYYMAKTKYEDATAYRRPEYYYNVSTPAATNTGRWRTNLGATGDLALAMHDRRHGI